MKRQSKIIKELLEIGFCERYPLRSFDNDQPEPLFVNYDYLTWAQQKPLRPLQEFKFEKPKMLKFSLGAEEERKIESFNSLHKQLDDWSYYFNANELIQPKDTLLYDISYLD